MKVMKTLPKMWVVLFKYLALHPLLGGRWWSNYVCPMYK